MKKQLPALIAAILMTSIIALVMVVTSANALFNTNSVDPSNSQTTNVSAPADSNSNAAQIQQLQDRINEYAQREQQYQQREQQLQQTIQSDQQQVQEAASEIQQIQQLLAALQQRGLISIQRNGTILITGQGGN